MLHSLISTLIPGICEECQVTSWCADPGALLCRIPEFSPDSAGSTLFKSVSESRADDFPELVSDCVPHVCLTGQWRGVVG